MNGGIGASYFLNRGFLPCIPCAMRGRVKSLMTIKAISDFPLLSSLSELAEYKPQALIVEIYSFNDTQCRRLPFSEAIIITTNYSKPRLKK